MSKTTQNELLACIGKFFVNEIAAEMHPTSETSSCFFGVLADEVTDWEQLGVVVRYVKGSEIIERLVSFIDCESTTGESICEKI